VLQVLAGAVVVAAGHPEHAQHAVGPGQGVGVAGLDGQGQGVPGQLLGGRLAGTDSRRLAVRYACLYAGAVLAGLSVRAAGPTVLGVALAGLFSLLIFLGQPITNQLVARSTRAGRRGAAYGTYFSLSFGVGALAGAAGGVVADRSGLAAVFGFLGLVAVVNTLGGLAVRVLLDRRSESTGRASAA
jgi:predicted MFS family arabinose efflux permease